MIQLHIGRLNNRQTIFQTGQHSCMPGSGTGIAKTAALLAFSLNFKVLPLRCCSPHIALGELTIALAIALCNKNSLYYLLGFSSVKNQPQGVNFCSIGLQLVSFFVVVGFLVFVAF